MARKSISCFIALGTNLGDRLANLARAQALLAKKVRIVRESSIYETAPWGVTDQPAFLNQVIEGKTTSDPDRLLVFLKQIEEQMGRQKTYRYGPRLIDLDILLMDDLVVSFPELIIPHPRMVERAFVMVPLDEIAPDLIIPGTSRTVHNLLADLDRSGVSLFKGEA